MTNCANHPDRERAAFCQNCGKPLCTECIRNIGASVFCEPCFTARTAAPAPGAYPGYTPGPVPPGYAPGPAAVGIPNPGLAALLGFIPGVGAMYNEQYAKGIVHLMVFAILVSLSHQSGIFGLFVAGWIFYMVIEAHHTARARRDGTPLPNPFGLNDLSERLGFGRSWPTAAPFAANPDPASQPAPGQAPPYSSAPPYTPPYTYVPPVSNWGAPQEQYPYNAPPIPPVPPVPPMPPYVDPNVPYYRRFPAGAIWLIGLGIFFLLGNSGIWHLHSRFFGPFLLIAVGVWIFVRRMTCTGGSLANDGTPGYGFRLAMALRGALWTILIGVIWLLDLLHILSWNSSWPILLIAGGVMLLFKRSLYGGYGYGFGAGPYPGYPNTPPPTPPVQTTTTTAIVPTHDQGTRSGDQEGR
jgi:hypothetical protein